MIGRIRASVSTETAATAFVLVGLALLVNPIVPGVHVMEVTITQYDAARVTYDATDGLRVVDATSGEVLHGIEVDRDVICERGYHRYRDCSFERAVLAGRNVPTRPEDISRSRYAWVYLDDTFYRPTVDDRANGSFAALEPVDPGDALDRIADRGPPTEPERQAIEDGSLLVYGELPVSNRLVRHDGAYYTVYRSESETYGLFESSCGSDDREFCNAAVTKWWTDNLLTVGSRLLGGGLLAVGYHRRRRGTVA